MIPLTFELLPRVAEMSRAIPFAGEWAWAVERFWNGVVPDAFLLRIDWSGGEPRAVTLYCRFSVEPDADAFKAALTHAEPFRWSGPDPSAIGASLGAVGPRGIAFRASGTGSLRTALYFRSDDHAGRKWIDRLAGLVEACGYPDGLLATIESHLNDLYQPGPVGVLDSTTARTGSLERSSSTPQTCLSTRSSPTWRESVYRALGLTNSGRFRRDSAPKPRLIWAYNSASLAHRAGDCISPANPHVLVYPDSRT